MTGPGIYAGAVQVLPEFTGQGPNEREVQIPLAAAVDRRGDVHRPNDTTAHHPHVHGISVPRPPAPVTYLYSIRFRPQSRGIRL